MPGEQIYVMQKFVYQLNKAQLEIFVNDADIKPGIIVAAPYTTPMLTMYHRAKILDIFNDAYGRSCEVKFYYTLK